MKIMIDKGGKEREREDVYEKIKFNGSNECEDFYRLSFFNI
jgi:hypothetical protein